MLRTIAILSLCCTALLVADDIYLKSGRVIRNVKITGESDRMGNDAINFTYYHSSKTEDTFIVKYAVDSVAFSPVNFSETSFVVVADSASVAPLADPMVSKIDSLQHYRNTQKSLMSVSTTEFQNIHWLAFGAFFAVLSWDHFAEAGIIQDQIDYYDKLNKLYSFSFDSSDLQSSKNRKMAVGIIGVGLGLYCVIHALTPVTVTTDGKSITMQYTF